MVMPQIQNRSAIVNCDSSARFIATISRASTASRIQLHIYYFQTEFLYREPVLHADDGKKVK